LATPDSTKANITIVGVNLGTVLAVVLSWDMSGSLLYAFFHGILGWLYVVYYAARYILFV